MFLFLVLVNNNNWFSAMSDLCIFNLKYWIHISTFQHIFGSVAYSNCVKYMWFYCSCNLYNAVLANGFLILLSISIVLNFIFYYVYWMARETETEIRYWTLDHMTYCNATASHISAKDTATWPTRFTIAAIWPVCSSMTKEHHMTLKTQWA